jgi:hypothetical protein
MTEADIADGDTASQTASTPRPVMNAAKTVAAPKPVQAPTIDASQPAIDEKSFTLPIQATPVQAIGEGGPFIATSASSTPVASTLINGEPVVVLRIGPMFATNAARSAEAANVVDEAASEIAPQPSTPSPQAILSLSSAESAPVKVASVEPQMMAARPRTKPAAAELVVEVAKPKPARPAPVRTAAAQPQPDVYQPSAISDLAFDEAPAAAMSTQAPGDIPAEHQAIPATVPLSDTDSATPATTGPASLVQLPQE